MTFPINISEQAGVRYLYFGSSWIQGAMRIARPWNLELEYTREMMISLLLRDITAWPRHVLQIGLGAASLTKFLYRNCSRADLTVVEIEPTVVTAARQFFKLPDNPRLRIEIRDGVEYMLQTDKKFDLILVDAFDEHGRSGCFETLSFYRACRRRMSEDGIIAINLLTGVSSFYPTTLRIAKAFDDRSLVFPSCESGNAIALAAAGTPVDVSFDDLRDMALAIKTENGLNLLPTLTRLQQAKTCLNNRLIL